MKKMKTDRARALVEFPVLFNTSGGQTCATSKESCQALQVTYFGTVPICSLTADILTRSDAGWLTPSADCPVKRAYKKAQKK
jgi:hypothetical protein